MLFGSIGSCSELFFVLLVFLALFYYWARQWLDDNPDVKDAANDAAKAKAKELIKKYLK